MYDKDSEYYDNYTDEREQLEKEIEQAYKNGYMTEVCTFGEGSDVFEIVERISNIMGGEASMLLYKE